jgi:hypothetical protein
MYVLADSPRQPETIIGGRPSTQLLLTEGQPIFSSHKELPTLTSSMITKESFVAVYVE